MSECSDIFDLHILHVLTGNISVYQKGNNKEEKKDNGDKMK